MKVVFNVNVNDDEDFGFAMLPSGWQLRSQASLLCKAKANGAKAHSSAKLKFPSSQPTLFSRRRYRYRWISCTKLRNPSTFAFRR